MKFRDIANDPATVFIFEDEQIFTPYMILTQNTHLGYVSIVSLGLGNTSSFSEEDSVMDREVKTYTIEDYMPD